MYIHLGQDTVIKQEDIIGIFDLDTSTVSRHTKNYLNKAQKMGEVVYVTNELPKSFILCVKDKKRVIYISQLSSLTLLKRSKFIETEQKNARKH